MGIRLYNTITRSLIRHFRILLVPRFREDMHSRILLLSFPRKRES